MNSSKKALEQLIEQGLKVGSKVRVTEKTYPRDFDDTWTDYMDEWIDEEAVVKQIHLGGNKLELQLEPCGDSFFFPATSVELVREKKTEHNQKFEVDITFIKQAHKAACSDWKKKIEEQFPDAFKPVYFDFGKEHKINRSFDSERSPLVIANGYAPDGLRDQTLIVDNDYELEVREHSGFTQLLFKYKN